jgi:hypothetical protein
VIGALTILDDQPRYGISHRDLTLMEALSDTIVEQLHATVVRAQQQRSERLMQSMSLFNDGERSMRDWWMSQDDARVHNKGRMHLVNNARHTVQGSNRAVRADAEFGRQGTPVQQQDTASHASDNVLSVRAPDRVAAAAESTSQPQSRANVTDVKEARAGERRTNQQKRSAEDGNDLATSTSAAYSRAANLMREAMGIEGIVFINLDHSAGNMNQFPTSSESGDSSASGEENQSCDVYSSSVRHSSSDGRIGIVNTIKLRAKQLRRMIRCHPHGVVLQIEADGTIVNTSSDDSDQSGSNNERERLNRQVKQDMQTLGALVPNISSAALYPLRDDSNGQWRSCIFAWSTNLNRILDKNQDLAYMQSFGHSLLSELARLEALAADYAKATFISSISHELRSPLHGILAVCTFFCKHDREHSDFRCLLRAPNSCTGRISTRSSWK